MAAFNFPNSPSVNQTHTENGITFKWDGEIWKRAGIAGAQGSQGAQGHQGIQGAQGAQGVQGAPGPQGHQGVQGAQGATGAQGHQGRQGSAGAQGAHGAQGAQGAQGHQGVEGEAELAISTTPPGSPDVGDMWWDSEDGNLYTWFNDGNSSQWVSVSQGPMGAQGLTGSGGGTGAQGHQGRQGAQGAQGHQGNPNAFPSGTMMMFVQQNAPTGWTKSTANNNRALRIVSGTSGGNQGGNNEFTAVFTSSRGTTGGNVGNHTLTTAQIPSHRHWVSRARRDDNNFSQWNTNTQEFGLYSDAGS